MKNKTLATLLALLGGPIGLHRFYLHGWRDGWGWFMPVPTLVGMAGVLRTRQFGMDDQLAWLLSPWLGLSIAASALAALIYGLSSSERWNRRFNPTASSDATAGNSNGFTISIVVLAMLVGTTALITALALTFQHIFEFQSLT